MRPYLEFQLVSGSATTAGYDTLLGHRKKVHQAGDFESSTDDGGTIPSSARGGKSGNKGTSPRDNANNNNGSSSKNGTPEPSTRGKGTPEKPGDGVSGPVVTENPNG